MGRSHEKLIGLDEGSIFDPICLILVLAQSNFDVIGPAGGRIEIARSLFNTMLCFHSRSCDRVSGVEILGPEPGDPVSVIVGHVIKPSCHTLTNGRAEFVKGSKLPRKLTPPGIVVGLCCCSVEDGMDEVADLVLSVLVLDFGGYFSLVRQP